MSSATSPVRLAGGLGVLWGLGLLDRGPRIWHGVTGSRPSPVDRVALAALGVRHLAQGAVQGVAPRRLRRTFVAIDVIHVVTMLPVAVVDERRRRAALLTSAFALASAATTLVATRRDPAKGR